MIVNPLLLGLGGGGGGRSVDNPIQPRMTKEFMMEDLVKRSADSSGSPQPGGGNSGASAPDSVWQETGAGFIFDLGKARSCISTDISGFLEQMLPID